ncbi:MAG: hypothetical protein JGK24_00325 [Microcoleus sp. PH2017_29_MFU_D_A]|uniref:hypothetical protein n=1 Tax=unclassified Microcoleus TaxID=2642155 RepID=UPI001D95E6DB|nr:MULTISPECIES: hypothetical protein [unclassified Microcoleus]MCC3419168.1 hypothetical protein [Microcoleus sp. PH2017_07_MST_O_A]MCC3441810.1 hypothetical protein [Microcoleus sp. PH2017_03_ELD_O_A]MCC3502892.1 hypothetical protein [Microcoleus sp. PH2017_19_SFW_U_A]MCC3509074.1 hypothetical protein [Microcoleus sp. PH2017_17_BER_D_A]TAE07478.1 MAG: hypothetical protein EAZ94_28455 [Oscillatoriales cyanobacterium]
MRSPWDWLVRRAFVLHLQRDSYGFKSSNPGGSGRDRQSLAVVLVPDRPTQFDRLGCWVDFAQQSARSAPVIILSNIDQAGSEECKSAVRSEECKSFCGGD